MLSGSLLQQLVDRHHHNSQPINLGVYYKNTLVALCHALEDFVLQADQPPLMLTAFQRGKWYLQEADRYGEIAPRARHITILANPDAGFADHPTSRRENVSLIALNPDDPVGQEWHLIILSPTYSAMVLCQELTAADYGAAGQPTADLERKFYGFWTFEPELVTEMAELAIAHVQTYDDALATQLTTQLATCTEQTSQHPRDDLNTVVTQVVRSLQRLHEQPIALIDFLADNLRSNELQALLRMAELIDQADTHNPNAAAEVATLAEAMAQLLDLPAWQVKRLRLASLLHRLGPLGTTHTATSSQTPTQQEVLAQKGLLPNAQVLRVMPQLQAITNVIVHQREWWDGTGLPDALAYDDIPLESRILGLVVDFQNQVHVYQSQNHDNPIAQALSDCQAQAGTRYDPKLVETIAVLVMGLQQGMDLSINQIKIASGIWLLDEES
ncbi:MAG: metal-dependent phosphohydrolase [Spirulina sp. SIO3F2]|nr:metal-dependent phosphohydrolase [Spirulina sp. SIO3F2]